MEPRSASSGSGCIDRDSIVREKGLKARAAMKARSKNQCEHAEEGRERKRMIAGTWVVGKT